MSDKVKKVREANDVIYTRPEFAKRIITHFKPLFKPEDTFLDPCRGKGAFYDSLPDNKDWCEIVQGRDFLNYSDKVDWTFANFPWSSKIYRPMAKKAFEASNNVVSLIRLHNAFGTFARHNDYLEHGHQINEVIICNWQEAFFDDKETEGFALAIIHYSKIYKNSKWSYWT